MNTALGIFHRVRVLLLLPLSLVFLLYAVADPIGDALGQPGLVWDTPAAKPWLVQTTTTHDGVGALQRYAYNSDDQSTVSTTVTGPLQVTFWWKCSPLQNFGYLAFNAVAVDDPGALGTFRQITGEQDWQKMSVGIGPGRQRLTWTVHRSIGWLDEVGFSERQPEAPAFGASSDSQPFGPTVLAGATVALTTRVGGYPLSLQWYKDGQPVPDATNRNLVISNAPASATGRYQLVASNQLGVVGSQTAAVYVAQPLILTPLATYTVTNGTIRGIGAFSRPSSAAVRPVRNRPRLQGTTDYVGAKLESLGIDLTAEFREGGGVVLREKVLVFSGGKLIEVDGGPSPTSGKRTYYVGDDAKGSILNTYIAAGTGGVEVLRTYLKSDGYSAGDDVFRPPGNVVAVGNSYVDGRGQVLVVLTDTAVLAYRLKSDGNVDSSLPPITASLDSIGLKATVMSVDQDKIVLGAGAGVQVLKIGADGAFSFAAVPKDVSFNTGGSQVTIQAGTPGTAEPDRITVVNTVRNIGSIYSISTDATGKGTVGPRASFAPANDLKHEAYITDQAQSPGVTISGVKVPNVGGKVMVYDTGVAALLGAFKNPLLVGSAPSGGRANDDTWVAAAGSFVISGCGDTVTVFAATPEGRPPQIIEVVPDIAEVPHDGTPITFKGITAPTEGLTYEWRFNGTALAGAVSETLEFAPAVAGKLVLVVKNRYGEDHQEVPIVIFSAPSPSIQIKVAEKSAEVRWPAELTGGQLQINTGDPGNRRDWKPADPVITTENGTTTATVTPLPVSSVEVFFRLLFPERN